MDEAKVREIAQSVVDEKNTARQYTTASIPFHKHTGIDSSQISFNNLVDVGIDATVVIIASGVTTTFVFEKGLLTSYTQV